ncbi:MAG: hypothetical protein GKR86_02830 [Ilumatobacter sp.]|nr:hypothetical protein [Ilumatobacter sp.]
MPMIDRVRQQVDALSARTLVAVASLAVALPLLVAVVALAQRRWYPVLDLAMTEFRIQDVGTRQTPLIGLPGRIGELPDQGSHPGPLSFWLLAPAYRLFGGSAWAMEVATVSVALMWIAVAMWIGHRRLGRAGIALVAAIIAILVRGFGLSVLSQPWNPYMPLLAWLVVLLGAWAVLDGDDMMLIPLVAAASFAAQTHIPYLLMAGAIGLVAVVVVLVRWSRTRGSDERSSPPRSVLVTIAVFVVLWLAPLVDQIRRNPGNIKRLLDHFGSPDEEPIGYGAGIRLMLRHLDAVGAHLGLLVGQERFLEEGFDPDGPIWAGMLLLAAWIVACFVAFRLRHRSLVALHSLLAVTLVLTTISMSRIFGKRWYYLTLWAWVTTTLLIVATLWTAVAWLRSYHPNVGRRISRAGIATTGVLVALIVTASMIVLAPSTDHPEEYLGDTLGELVDPTAAALDPEGTYVVEWKDAYFFGSQAFGLVSELRRAGYNVGAGEFWTVPVTPSRVVPTLSADDALVFVTGGFVEQWRSDDRFIELASVDPRSAEELVEYEYLRSDLIVDLKASRLDDLVPLVDTNLFVLNIDQRISVTARALIARMIRVGQETAVFLGPPGTSV